jgi:hypothetical protein
MHAENEENMEKMKFYLPKENDRYTLFHVKLCSHYFFKKK